MAGIAIAVLGALTAAAAGLGYRFELWSLSTAFAALGAGAWTGLAGAGVSIAGAVRARPRGPRRGFWLALLGLAIGIATAGLPYAQLRIARSVPPIHDITTDTETPPEFVAVLPLRADAPNPSEHGGPEVAAQQRAAYPDIGPALLEVTPEAAFDRALAATSALGWQIAAADRAAYRIEATDVTFWFGFEDDVVIRIRPAEGGSRVDIRSVSRVGQSDVGANARRIRRFLAELGAR